jgi:hypothetical protein
MLHKVLLLSACVHALVPPQSRRTHLTKRHAEPDLAALFAETPCFALADADGQLALLDDGKNKAIEFYIDADVAVKRKQYWDVDGDKLTVKPLSLGKALAAYGDDETAARFVASPDELNEARRIFVRCSGGDVPESLEELLATYEALDPRKSFATPLDVPLFCIDALRLSADEPAPCCVEIKFGVAACAMAWRFHAIDATSWRLDGVEDNLAHWSISTQAPWYFSSKDLLETWETASGKPREEAYDSISMMNLREMLKVLKSPKVPVKPSTFLAAMANLEAVGRR